MARVRGKSAQSRVIETRLPRHVYDTEDFHVSPGNVKHSCICCAHKLQKQQKAIQTRREHAELASSRSSRSSAHIPSLEFDSVWREIDSELPIQALSAEQQARHMWVLNRKGITMREVKRWRKLAIKLRDSWKLKAELARAKEDDSQFKSMPSFIKMADLNRAAVWLWIGLLEHYTLQIQKVWRGHRVRIALWKNRNIVRPRERRRVVRKRTPEEKVIACQAVVRGWLARRKHVCHLKLSPKSEALVAAKNAATSAETRACLAKFTPQPLSPTASHHPSPPVRPASAAGNLWNAISHHHSERPSSAAPRLRTQLRGERRRGTKQAQADSQLHSWASGSLSNMTRPRLHYSALDHRLSLPSPSTRGSILTCADQAIGNAQRLFYRTQAKRDNEVLENAFVYRGLNPGVKKHDQWQNNTSSFVPKSRSGFLNNVYTMHSSNPKLPPNVKRLAVQYLQISPPRNNTSFQAPQLVGNSSSKYITTRSYVRLEEDGHQAAYSRPRSRNSDHGSSDENKWS